MTGVVALDAVASGLVSLDTPSRCQRCGRERGRIVRRPAGGRRLTLETALYALLVPSGNDAAVAIAEHIGRAMRRGWIRSGGRVRARHERQGGRRSAASTPSTEPARPRLRRATRATCTAARPTGEGRAVRHEQRHVPRDRGRRSTDIHVDARRREGRHLPRDHRRVPRHLRVRHRRENRLHRCWPVRRSRAPPTRTSASCTPSSSHSSSEAQRFVDAKTLCEWVYQHEISYQLANSPQTTTMNGTEVPVVAEVAHTALDRQDGEGDAVAIPQAAVDHLRPQRQREPVGRVRRAVRQREGRRQGGHDHL